MGFDPNARGYNGMRPLLRAAAQGKLEAMKELIAHDADVNAADDDGYTALHLAPGVDVTKELIAHGHRRRCERRGHPLTVDLQMDASTPCCAVG